MATTVFNAVYDAGYAVPSRTNHSLYVASYPQGAMSPCRIPTLISSGSTIPLPMFCCEQPTPTRALPLHCTVSIPASPSRPRREIGSKGEARDEDHHRRGACARTSYTKTAGTDGMEITVVRTVK